MSKMIEESKAFPHMFKVFACEPVYTLAECVELLEHGKEHYSEVDCELDFITGLQKRFRKAIYMCNESELAFLDLAVEATEKKSEWSLGTQINGEYPLPKFVFNDFLYLFEPRENASYLVLPCELVTIYREARADENFAVKLLKKSPTQHHKIRTETTNIRINT